MVDFVAFFEASEDGDGFGDGWFVDEDGLEAPFEGFVFFDVLSVLVEGGCSYASEFSSGEHGFEHIGGVEGSFGFAGSDEGVHLVDEEDDFAFGLFDFVEYGFESFFELASVFGAGDEGSHVEGDDGFVAESFGDVSGYDSLGEAFGDGGFADAGLSDEDGVVFGASGEDLDGPADLFVSSDDGVEFAGAGACGEVDAVFFEGLEGVFGSGVVDLASGADVLDSGLEVFFGDTVCGEGFSGGSFVFGEGEEEVFGGDVLVSHFFGEGEGVVEGGLESSSDGGSVLGGGGDFGGVFEGFLDVGFDEGGLGSGFLKDGVGDAGVVGEDSIEEVFGFDGLVLVFGGGLLGGLEGLLGFDGEFVEAHGT